MEQFKYLIVGGGMAGDAAVRGIRKVDQDGSIGVISQEMDLPYTRPYLSKALWKGKPLEKVWRHTEQFKADFRLGSRVEALDLDRKQVVDQRGQTYGFEKLLLATGGTPRQLPNDAGEIIYYRSLDDYRKLRNLADSHKQFVIIGGGFIGSEVAASLAMNDREVTMIFPQKAIADNIFPADVASYLNDYFKKKGVDICSGEMYGGVEKRGDSLVVKTSTGKEIPAGGVVAGIGIAINTSLAEKAGLKVDNGIVVDETMRSSHPDVYAAGDVANFYNPSLGKRLRVEHEDNALSMGEIAGLNMAGEKTAYTRLPYFYSDLFEIGYEAVGELNSKLETFADWQEPMKKGAIYYLENGRVRGVLLWDIWGKIDEARKLIAEPGPFQAQDLRGKIV